MNIERRQFLAVTGLAAFASALHLTKGHAMSASTATTATESAVNVKVAWVRLTCDRDGLFMTPTGVVAETYPVLHEHVCANKHTALVPEVYPHPEYRDANGVVIA